MIRPRLLELLDKVLDGLLNQATQGDEFGGTLSRLELPGYRPQKSDRRLLPGVVVELILDLLLNPGFPLEARDVNGVERKIAAGEKSLSGDPSRAHIEQSVSFAREYLSLPKMRERVAMATQSEFQATQADLRTLIQCFQSTRPFLPAMADWDALERDLITGIGYWVAVADLALRNAGHADWAATQIGRVADLWQRAIAAYQSFRASKENVGPEPADHSEQNA